MTTLRIDKKPLVYTYKSEIIFQDDIWELIKEYLIIPKNHPVSLIRQFMNYRLPLYLPPNLRSVLMDLSGDINCYSNPFLTREISETIMLKACNDISYSHINLWYYSRPQSDYDTLVRYGILKTIQNNRRATNIFLDSSHNITEGSKETPKYKCSIQRYVQLKTVTQYILHNFKKHCLYTDIDPILPGKYCLYMDAQQQNTPYPKNTIHHLLNILTPLYNITNEDHLIYQVGISDNILITNPTVVGPIPF